MDEAALIEDAVGEPVSRMTPLHGGCLARVFRVRTASDRDLAVKVSRENDGWTRAEAAMLQMLSRLAPTPEVVAVGDRVLALRYVGHDGSRSAQGEHRLGEIVARIHGERSDRFGWNVDSLIGAVTLANGAWDDWGRFYGQTRLRPLAEQAHSRGGVSSGFVEEIGRLAEELPALLADAEPPTLVHGDLWAGNVLWDRGAPAALIDPICIWADREVELAFIDLMGGVSGAFWEAYERERPIRPGFWERRVHVYQIVPLLIHEILFGDGYGGRAETALQRALEGGE